jgi:diketogulonate reductase-like aldo/keto reductase
MEYVYHHQMTMPALGFGTFELKGDVVRDMVSYALDIGYRHIDTAQIYDNEVEVGQGITRSGVDRSEIFLTTKVWVDCFEPKKLLASVDESLARLGTDYVDLLLLHWPKFEGPMEATLDALMQVRESHKARHIGVSNFTIAQLDKACSHLGAAFVQCNQVEYHPFIDQRTLRAIMAQRAVPLTAYMPLAKGRVVHDKVLAEIGAEYGKSPAQVALRWLLDQKVAAIPATTSQQHARENLDIFDFSLSAEDRERIAALPKDVRVCNPASLAPDWDD